MHWQGWAGGVRILHNEAIGLAHFFGVLTDVVNEWESAKENEE